MDKIRSDTYVLSTHQQIEGNIFMIRFLTSHLLCIVKIFLELGISGLHVNISSHGCFRKSVKYEKKKKKKAVGGCSNIPKILLHPCQKQLLNVKGAYTDFLLILGIAHHCPLVTELSGGLMQLLVKPRSDSTLLPNPFALLTRF